MEIKITSKETIKPSLPTPNERKSHKLCLFDVFQMNTYFPLILFYHKRTNDTQGPSHVSSQLKKSLSEALTIFYPLAGRRSDPFTINCNDEGAIYVEASLNINMDEFLKPPKLEDLSKLLPCEANKTQPYQEILPQLVIQVNTFKCGGIAIGLCNLHTLLDACSCNSFMKTWFSFCKLGTGEEIRQLPSPDFTSAPSSFPPRNTFGARAGVLNYGKESKIEAMCTTKRFLFDTKAIVELKAKAANDDLTIVTNTKPTRYQVLSSFVCKHMILACKNELQHCDGYTRPVVLLHVVDMRGRMGDPLSQDSIGNLVWPLVILCDNVNKDTKIGELVRVLGGEFGKLNKEMFLKVKNDDGFFWSDEYAGLMLEGIEAKSPISFVVTSWANLGFNELDFGLGKPLWLAQGGGAKERMPNTVVFLETDDGMEAWVVMEEKHMTILENDMDFLKFALINPNVSGI